MNFLNSEGLRESNGYENIDLFLISTHKFLCLIHIALYFNCVIFTANYEQLLFDTSRFISSFMA